jgi:Proto-chlorophyllide reductase 57 kD subunit
MARAAAEARADRKRVAEITELFVRTLGRKLGHGHPLSDRTGMAEFTWTPEAEERLREVPEFCRELTRWRVEWTAHKLGLGTTITPEVMQVKFDMWGRVSHAIRDRHDDGLPWTDEAHARFERIPEFVRGQVLEAVEGNARRMGATVVDDAVVDRVIAQWVETGDFHEGLYGFR